MVTNDPPSLGLYSELLTNIKSLAEKANSSNVRAIQLINAYAAAIREETAAKIRALTVPAIELDLGDVAMIVDRLDEYRSSVISDEVVYLGRGVLKSYDTMTFLGHPPKKLQIPGISSKRTVIINTGPRCRNISTDYSPYDYKVKLDKFVVPHRPKHPTYTLKMFDAAVKSTASDKIYQQTPGGYFPFSPDLDDSSAFTSTANLVNLSDEALGDYIHHSLTKIHEQLSFSAARLIVWSRLNAIDSCTKVLVERYAKPANSSSNFANLTSNTSMDSLAKLAVGEVGRMARQDLIKIYAELTRPQLRSVGYMLCDIDKCIKSMVNRDPRFGLNLPAPDIRDRARQYPTLDMVDAMDRDELFNLAVVRLQDAYTSFHGYTPLKDDVGEVIGYLGLFKLKYGTSPQTSPSTTPDRTTWVDLQMKLYRQFTPERVRDKDNISLYQHTLGLMYDLMYPK